MDGIQLRDGVLLRGLPIDVSELAHRTEAFASATVRLDVQSLFALEAGAIVGEDHWAAVVTNGDQRPARDPGQRYEGQRVVSEQDWHARIFVRIDDRNG